MMILGPKAFMLIAVLWIVGGNLLAWHLGWHYSMFGYCQGWGCGR